MQVVFISSWFPTRYNRFPGIFVQRLAEALAPEVSVTVIHAALRPASDALPDKEVYTENGVQYNYTYLTPSPIPVIGKYLDKWRWWKTNLRLFRQYIREYGKPDLIHAHVSWPAGWMARQLSRRYKVPYGIREHWTVFLPEDDNQLTGVPMKLAAKAFRDADFVSPDAARLGTYLAPYCSQAPVHIPNVVDTTLFHPAPEKKNAGLLHVSTLNDAQKNISGLLRAFAALLKQHPDAVLTMAGHDIRPAYLALCDSLRISESVIWTGSLSPSQVAEHLQRATALVLFSHAENAPVVISEALCCGTPVIATRVGGIADMVSPEDGILVDAADEEALTCAMADMLQHSDRFNRSAISSKAQQIYSPDAVRRRWLALYHSILSKSAA